MCRPTRNYAATAATAGRSGYVTGAKIRAARLAAHFMDLATPFE
jgi:hypothetical protein